jgi:UDP-3-O-[3-hydroxymyristoyl] glucosamine N-acyltransferase
MVSVEKIINNLKVKEFIGNEQAVVKEPIQVNEHNLRQDVLMWVGPKYSHLLDRIEAGTILCASMEGIVPKPHCNYVVVEQPRSAFRLVLEKFFVVKKAHYISEAAIIHPSARLAQNITVGHHVVIEEDCEIGEGSVIGHNSVLHARTKIGKAVTIGANCTIGGVGFGYEKDEQGQYQFIPHIGNVVIEDRVEIGNNTTIDRGVMGSTLLRENCKVDNLVHIAHGVHIGRNSLVIANAMVAGSVTIGENVWVAPSTSILNGKKVADQALIGMGAVVVKDVEKEEIVVGNPAKPLSAKVK